MIKRKAIFSNHNDNCHSLNNGEWDFEDVDTQQYLHFLHPYPARFIPQIPHKAITNWTFPGDLVFDPFCGCGTSLLESMLLGRDCIGVDNNPVATLISEAKTNSYSLGDLRVLDKLAVKIDQLVKDISYSHFLPDYKSFDYWFSDCAKIDLARLKAVINNLPQKSKVLCLAIFSSIIVRVSNQDSDTRYARISRIYYNGDAIKWFKVRLNEVISRLKNVPVHTTARITIYCKDSRELSFIEDESIKLIVTSPPYINAYDYHKYHRHRIHWIDGDVVAARDNEIGKHDTFTRPKATPDKYFEDMLKCFAHWKRILQKGGHAFIVIGDGIVSGKPVAVGDKFIELCQNVGLLLKKQWIRKLQKNKKSFNQMSRIDKEHLLLFKKM